MERTGDMRSYEFSFGKADNPSFKNPTTMKKNKNAQQIAQILLEANGAR